MHVFLRFDGRSLLDFVPDTRNQRGYQDISKDDREMKDELNFERYHDLIEAERLNGSQNKNDMQLMKSICY